MILNRTLVAVFSRSERLLALPVLAEVGRRLKHKTRERTEIDAMLDVAKQRQLKAQGRRDYAMLLFLYNTGARADEAARLTIADLHLTPAEWNGQAYV